MNSFEKKEDFTEEMASQLGFKGLKGVLIKVRTPYYMEEQNVSKPKNMQ